MLQVPKHIDVPALEGWASGWILFTWEKSPVGTQVVAITGLTEPPKLRAGAKYWGCGTAPAVSFQSGLHGPFGTYIRGVESVQVIALDRAAPPYHTRE